MTSGDHRTAELDVVVVGAGFAGLYALHRFRSLGLRTRVFEAGGGVGGTWYWNRYPGARCDVESMEYSYQFSDELQQEWQWSQRYAPQAEILRYLEHVADRFSLRPDIQLDTRVEAASWDREKGRWGVRCSDGSRWNARFFVMATGCLSAVNMPEFPGRDSFHGPIYHTARWPHDGVHFDGQRVGVIGTGSSGVQSIPLIAAEAAHLTVFQRTPTWSIPAHNRALDPEEVRRVKETYPELRKNGAMQPFGFDTRSAETAALDVSGEERQVEFEDRWRRGGLAFLGGYNDLVLSREANDTAAEFVRTKIRAIVENPAVAAKLTPATAVGCKRLCVDTDYYATFNRDNVTLVDVSTEPIEEITPAGIRTSAAEYGLDAIVFATGFDAMTGALLAVDIRGRDGMTLKQKWAAGPRTYLGLSTAGFPNFFFVTGPGSPSVLTNMVPSIEQHVNWISRLILHVIETGGRTIEARTDAENGWVDLVNEIGNLTIYPTCNSWYLGSNVPGKPRVFMPYLGFPDYVMRVDAIAANGYEGFEIGA
ncbi:MAG TPA: NAD(P)/FAD-dependent oxidoreductase [Candidatus Binatia bacterium]